MRGSICDRGRISRFVQAFARITPRLAHRAGAGAAGRAHAWLILKTNGRVGTRFVAGSRLLVLRTVGRKSGQMRESPMVYVADGPNAVVCASNGASQRPPAWWL